MILIEVNKLVNAMKVGYLARKVTVTVPMTRLNHRILEIFRELFIVSGFTVDKSLKVTKVAVVLLKYSSGKPVINQMRVVEKHVSFKELCDEGKYRQALIISTSCGVITRIEALALGIGGVVLIELS